MAGPPAKKVNASTEAKPKRKLSSVKSSTSRLRQQQKRDKVVQEVDVNKVYHLFKGDASRGIKIVVYAQSGMGKTTLCTMAPNPIFIAADDGIDTIMHPVTNKPIPVYKADSYQDVRNILAQPKLFKGYDTIVLDTATSVEELAEEWVLAVVPTDKGKYVKSLEHYGWGKGSFHLSEAMNVVKRDLQKLANQGFNIIVVCQVSTTKRAEAGLDDYLKDMPKIVYRPNVKATAGMDYVEWADHVLRISYCDMEVEKGTKRVSSSGQRAIFVQPEAHFEAKSRTIPGQFPVVSFEDKTDDSVWKFIFEDAWKDLIVEEEDDVPDES
jgi:hypothetical protein